MLGLLPFPYPFLFGICVLVFAFFGKDVFSVLCFRFHDLWRFSLFILFLFVFFVHVFLIVGIVERRLFDGAGGSDNVGVFKTFPRFLLLPPAPLRSLGPIPPP